MLNDCGYGEQCGECILERSEMVSNIHKSRPCTERSCFCMITFMLSALTMPVLFHFKDVNLIIFLVPVSLSLLHILFVLYCIFKLNSLVYMDDTKIWQKQFGKIVEIQYSNIQDIKLSESAYIRSSTLVTISENKKKISFERGSKSYDSFISFCTNDKNDKVIKRLKKLLERKGLSL